jgi:hypothetical protein
MSWAALLGLAAAAYALRALGPVLAGQRELRPGVGRVLDLLSIPVLAALVAVQTLDSGGEIVVDARARPRSRRRARLAARAVPRRRPRGRRDGGAAARGVGRSRSPGRPGQLICAIAWRPRSAISSAERSSLCVAICQTCPNGSPTCAKRSPQNMSSGGIVAVAPASTARR